MNSISIIAIVIVVLLIVQNYRLRLQLKIAQTKLLATGKKSALSALSAGLLHQISQPITALHGFIRFMKKEMPKDNRFYKSVILMDEQTIYLKDMLENMMEMIRHRAISKVHMNTNAVVVKSMSLLTDELRINRIGWRMNLQENLPDVYADPIHVQQIFMNLAINAIQALKQMPAGNARTLEISSYLETENHVGVCFKDNGPGISAEIREHIFDLFFSTKAEGSGIGLALCRDLIVEQGGSIDFHSYNGDTSFTVHFHAPKK